MKHTHPTYRLRKAILPTSNIIPTKNMIHCRRHHHYHHPPYRKLIIFLQSFSFMIMTISSAYQPTTISLQPKRRWHNHRMTPPLPPPQQQNILSKLWGTTTNNNNIIDTSQTAKDPTNPKQSNKKYHTINGVQCLQKTIAFPCPSSPNNNNNNNTNITLLEATAAAQDDLLNDLIIDDDSSKEDSNKIINSGDVYGAVVWPSSYAVAHYLLFNVTKNESPPLKGFHVLELGAGTGLISLVASIIGGAEEVVATDYETLPLEFLRYADRYLNGGGEERRRCEIQTAFLDITNKATPLPPSSNIIVAADVLYEPKTGIALANRIVQEGLYKQKRVIVGCSRGRKGRVAFLEELQRLLPHLHVCLGDSNNVEDYNGGGEETEGGVAKVSVGFKDVDLGDILPLSFVSCNMEKSRDAVSILDLHPALCFPPSFSSEEEIIPL